MKVLLFFWVVAVSQLYSDSLRASESLPCVLGGLLIAGWFSGFCKDLVPAF